MLPSPSMLMTRLVRIRKLRADRGRQSKAHRPHGARGQKRPRILQRNVLRGPHLMLTDAGGENRLAVHHLVQTLQNVLGLDQFAGSIVVVRVLLLELVEMRSPGRKVLGETVAGRQQVLRAAFASPTWRPVAALTLPSSAKSISICAIAFARGANSLGFPATRSSNRDATAITKVTVFDGVVGVRRAMHSQHLQRQRIGAVHCTQSHQGAWRQEFRTSSRTAASPRPLRN